MFLLVLLNSATRVQTHKHAPIKMQSVSLAPSWCPFQPLIIQTNRGHELRCAGEALEGIGTGARNVTKVFGAEAYKIARACNISPSSLASASQLFVFPVSNRQSFLMPLQTTSQVCKN